MICRLTSTRLFFSFFPFPLHSFFSFSFCSELGLEGNPLKCTPAILLNLTNITQICCVNSSNFAITSILLSSYPSCRHVFLNYLFLSLRYSNMFEEDGELYVWGQNTWGQLGQGHSRNIPVPTKVTFPGDKSNTNGIHFMF